MLGRRRALRPRVRVPNLCVGQLQQRQHVDRLEVTTETTECRLDRAADRDHLHVDPHLSSRCLRLLSGIGNSIDQPCVDEDTNSCERHDLAQGRDVTHVVNREVVEIRHTAACFAAGQSLKIRVDDHGSDYRLRQRAHQRREVGADETKCQDDVHLGVCQQLVDRGLNPRKRPVSFYLFVRWEIDLKIDR